MKSNYLLWGLALMSVSSTAYASPNASSLEAPQAKQANTGTCVGTVIDEFGEPLAGASVRIDGTKIAGMADGDGRFSLNNVKPGSKVTVSFVGYAPTTVVWNGSPLNIKMSSTESVLDEVVVMGYGVE